MKLKDWTQHQRGTHILVLVLGLRGAFLLLQRSRPITTLQQAETRAQLGSRRIENISNTTAKEKCASVTAAKE